VRAYDGVSYGEWSDIWNFSIETVVSISLPVSTVDFGNVSIGATYDTGDDSPEPIRVKNDGNVEVNVTVYGTDFWQQVLNPSAYFRFMCRANTSACPSGSANNWSDLQNNTAPAMLVAYMPYADNGNEIKSDMKIIVPSDEPAGAKNATIYYIASQA
jgi:hypothetical protein